MTWHLLMLWLSFFWRSLSKARTWCMMCLYHGFYWFELWKIAMIAKTTRCPCHNKQKTNEMIKPLLLRQAPLWSPHLLHWVLQLVPGPVWQSLHFVTHLKDNQYAINECAILNSWPYVIIFKFWTTIAWINNQYVLRHLSGEPRDAETL